MADQQHNQAPAQRPQNAPRGGGPGMMMSMPVRKAKDFKGTFKKLMLRLKPYRLKIAVVLVFALASTVFMIAGPKILGQATQLLYEGIMARITNAGDIDFEAIGRIAAIMLGLYFISALFNYLQGFIMTKVANDITYQMRKDVRAKVDKLPLKYFDTHNYGDVLSHITNDIDTINQSLTQGITSLITSMASILGIGVMMFSISWQMALVAMLVLPLSSFLIRAIMKKSQQYFKEQQKTIGRLNGQVEEMYGNHLIVKAFNGEEQAVAAFSKDNETLYGTNWKSQFFSGIMQPIMMFIGNFGYVLIAVLGGFFAATGRILLGDLQAFIQYMRQFTQPIGQIAAQSNAFQSAIAGAEKVFALLEETEEDADPADARDRDSVASKVSFRGIKFGYEPDTPVIKNFTFDVQPGQKIAIVGPTGAGKTTIVKLLMRFYDVQDGTILVDGTDIRNFKRNDLRSLFGMVLQDTWLYNGTIRENIRYGLLDATDKMVESAAQTAQVDHFVKTLADGYETVLNEESSNISSGQKQLLTIARAILANPKMLILDEATSSVDTRMEILIQKAMDRLMEGRTSFIIAHRLSTIKNADRILVMDKGDIVEIGTHEELLAKGGFYATLYNAQFEHLEPAVTTA